MPSFIQTPRARTSDASPTASMRSMSATVAPTPSHAPVAADPTWIRPGAAPPLAAGFGDPAVRAFLDADATAPGQDAADRTRRRFKHSHTATLRRTLTRVAPDLIARALEDVFDVADTAIAMDQQVAELLDPDRFVHAEGDTAARLADVQLAGDNGAMALDQRLGAHLDAALDRLLSDAACRAPSERMLPGRGEAKLRSMRRRGNLRRAKLAPEVRGIQRALVAESGRRYWQHHVDRAAERIEVGAEALEQGLERASDLDGARVNLANPDLPAVLLSVPDTRADRALARRTRRVDVPGRDAPQTMLDRVRALHAAVGALDPDTRTAMGEARLARLAEVVERFETAFGPAAERSAAWTAAPEEAELGRELANAYAALQTLDALHLEGADPIDAMTMCASRLGTSLESHAEDLSPLFAKWTLQLVDTLGEFEALRERIDTQHPLAAHLDELDARLVAVEARQADRQAALEAMVSLERWHVSAADRPAEVPGPAVSRFAAKLPALAASSFDLDPLGRTIASVLKARTSQATGLAVRLAHGRGLDDAEMETLMEDRTYVAKIDELVRSVPRLAAPIGDPDLGAFVGFIDRAFAASLSRDG